MNTINPAQPVIRATNDLFFKYLFGKEENSDLLLSFINAVLEDSLYPQITDVHIETPFILQDHATYKQTILDIRAVNAEGRQFNIEMQTRNETRFKERTLFYWARLYSSQLEKSDQYSELQPTISINILDFNLFPDLNNYQNCFMLAAAPENRRLLTDHLALYYLELPKMKTRTPSLNLEEWMYYFKFEGEKDVEYVTKLEKEFLKAHEEYLKFTSDKRLLSESISREKAYRDELTRIGTARKEGLETGHHEEKLETAKKMKAEKIEIEVISRCTGLSEEEIQAL